MFTVKQSLRSFSIFRRQRPLGMAWSSSAAGYLWMGNAAISFEKLPIRRNRWMSSTPMMEAEAEEESHFALILGKPGGGKGTISGKILQDFPQFHHVSTGDLLRRHVRRESEVGLKAAQYMKEGKLVPDELMISLVVDESTPFLEKGESLLLDGFPRTVGQAQALERSVHVDIVINLDIPNDTIIERLTDRWIHEPSGRIYSYSYKPPKVKGIDDVTGEPLIQRHDDKPETVRSRLELYDQSTSPLVQYYENNAVLKSFQGTESDLIYPEVKKWLDSCFD